MKTFGIFIGLIVSISIVFQIGQFYRFIQAGPRFTAHNGQELCERIQKLEQQVQVAIRPCDYDMNVVK